MAYDCDLIDVCLSCYLTDHHQRDGELLLGVIVDNTTTHAEVYEELQSELNVYDFDLPDWFDYDAARAAMRECIPPSIDAGLFDASLDPPDEDGESCYAWFLITYSQE